MYPASHKLTAQTHLASHKLTDQTHLASQKLTAWTRLASEFFRSSWPPSTDCNRKANLIFNLFSKHVEISEIVSYLYLSQPVK